MNRRQQILIFGFGPYRQFRENITIQIISALPAQAGLVKIIFPVRFQRRQFIEALHRHRPDAILGLGQSSRKRIEVETRARNHRRRRQQDRLRPIFKDQPKSLPVTLDIRTGRYARTSNDAGDYVCNYSMFVLLDEIRRMEMKTRLGFIHIPHNCDYRQASRYVRIILRQCHATSGKSPSRSRLEVRR